MTKFITNLMGKILLLDLLKLPNVKIGGGGAGQIRAKNAIPVMV
jgi:hypothetical protein